MRRASRIAVGLTLAMALGSCAQQAVTEGVYDLGEFYISGPELLSDGTSSVLVTNSGEFPHTLVVTTEMGTVIAATDLVQSGESVQLDLDLVPGVYRFTCRIVTENDGRLIDHFESGMNELVEVSD